MLFDIEPHCLEILDRKEGAPASYARTSVEVVDAEGMLTPATTYVAPGNNFIRPQPDYVDTVRQGLRDHGLPDDALTAAAGDLTLPFTPWHDERSGESERPTVPPRVDGVFVHGTLLRGQPLHALVQEHARSGEILPASIPGHLYDLGAYPGLRLPNVPRTPPVDAQHDANRGSDVASVREIAAGGEVHGQFVVFADIASALKTLDDVEGYRGPAREDNLYQRRLVKVRLSDTPVRPAWTYELAGLPDGGLIADGDWLRHKSGCRNLPARERAVGG